MASAIAPFLQDVPSATGWKLGAVPLAPQTANCLPSELQIMVPGEVQVLPEAPEEEPEDPEEDPEFESVDGEDAPAAAGEAATDGAAAAGEAAEGAAAAGEATEGAAEAPADDPPLGEAA